METRFKLLPLLLLLTLPAPGQAQFTFMTNNGAITITGHTGSVASVTNVTIPSTINGHPVTTIGNEAFEGCADLTNLSIPNSVTSIGYNAFNFCASLTSISIPNSVTIIGSEVFSSCSNLTSATIGSGLTNLGVIAFSECTSLTGVYFRGNAPGAASTVFSGDTNATVYYLPGTTGWYTPFGGCSNVVLWNPQVQTSDGSFGVRTNHVGFNITGTSNLVIVMEACTNLANPVWSPLQTITLTGSPAYFSDPNWTNYPSRFYGLGVP